MSDPISSSPLGNDSIDSNEPNFVAQLGRISGKLLSENLLRHGVDLTFRNKLNDPDILILDVTNSRIGINITPTVDLDVADKTIVRNNLISIGTTATFDNIIFNSNGDVTTVQGPINLVPTGPNSFIEVGKSLTPVFEFKDNYIKTTTDNTDIVIIPDGTGIVDIFSSVAIDGDLTVTGDINIDGNLSKQGDIIIGDEILDIVVINTDFSQSIIPGQDNEFNFGSTTKFWDTTWIQGELNAVNANINQTIISEQLQLSGNTISSLQSNDDITLNSGSENIILENIRFNNNEIVNLLDSPLTLSSTGIGYVRFTDTNALVIPVGTSAEREFIEIGETRWNTELGYLECFDGSVYLPATGGGAVITPAIQQELSELWTLIMG